MQNSFCSPLRTIFQPTPATLRVVSIIRGEVLSLTGDKVFGGMDVASDPPLERCSSFNTLAGNCAALRNSLSRLRVTENGEVQVHDWYSNLSLSAIELALRLAAVTSVPSRTSRKPSNTSRDPCLPPKQKCQTPYFGALFIASMSIFPSANATSRSKVLILATQPSTTDCPAVSGIRKIRPDVKCENRSTGSDASGCAPKIRLSICA